MDMKKNTKATPARTPLAVPTCLHRQRGILGRIFKSGALEIDIKNQSFSFDTIDDFKQFLSAKTEIPASKLQEMLKRSAQHLDEEIKQLKRIEDTINDKLAATIRNPKSIDSYLDDATMVRFSQDYDWRQIMFELSKKSTDFSEYKLEAVSNYMKYLRSRIEMAESIRNERNNINSLDNAAMTETVDTKALTDNYEEFVRDTDEHDNIEQPLSSTSCIDLSKEQNKNKKPADLVKIPRGRTVKVDVSDMEELPMKIASRKFVLLMGGDKIELLSISGDRYPLEMGENLIGRSTKCSIILDPELVDISRQHLVIEAYPDKTLHFTDLSSSGTQLPGNVFKA